MDTIVISIGGSIIVPESIDTLFLQNLKNIVEHHLLNKRFILVSGGGHTARMYQQAAQEVTALHDEDVDWLGIHATRLNAHLLRAIFREHAEPVINKNPEKAGRMTKSILVAAGWKPGWSTDYIAVALAKKFGVKKLINLSNITHVYTADPKTDPEARLLKEISWQAFRKLVGDVWTPGMNTPFDPIAAKEAETHQLKVIIAGKDAENLDKILSGKPFEGTIIH